LNRLETAQSYAAAAGAIVRRDASIFFSYRTRVFAQVASMMLSFAIFFYISQLIQVESFGSGKQYFAFVVVGLVIMEVLQAALTTPMNLRQEMVAGTFERLVASPLGPVAGAIAMCFFPILLGCGISAVNLGLAALLFGLPLEWSTAALAIPVAALGALAFSALGVLFMGAMVVFKQSMGMAWILAGLGLTAGVYFPVKLLPDWVRWVSDVQPFTPAVDLLRHLLLGLPAASSPALSLLKLALFAGLLLPVAGVTLRAAIQIARSKGTILEY
jgi:ABC-2 type transport system permease protein